LFLGSVVLGVGKEDIDDLGGWYEEGKECGLVPIPLLV